MKFQEKLIFENYDQENLPSSIDSCQLGVRSKITQGGQNPENMVFRSRTSNLGLKFLK